MSASYTKDVVGVATAGFYDPGRLDLMNEQFPSTKANAKIVEMIGQLHANRRTAYNLSGELREAREMSCPGSDTPGKRPCENPVPAVRSDSRSGPEGGSDNVGEPQACEPPQSGLAPQAGAVEVTAGRDRQPDTSIEVEARAYVECYQDRDNGQEFRYLSMTLDLIEGLRRELREAQAARLEAIGQLHAERHTAAAEMARAQAEIARLQSPPGSSAMERARTIWDEAGAHDWHGSTGHYHELVEKVVARRIEHAEREARAAAIEVLKRRSDQWGDEHNCGHPCSLTVRNELASSIDAIRATLAEPKPDVQDVSPQAPPGASAMERARRMYIDLMEGYGQKQLDIVTRHFEQAEREARAAAIEDAADLCDMTADKHKRNKHVRRSLGASIRALAWPKPE